MLSPAPPECGEGVPDDAGRDLNVRGECGFVSHRCKAAGQRFRAPIQSLNACIATV
jgi:hypothetical protein